jgi:CBS domain containing-hemolysin-like protein
MNGLTAEQWALWIGLMLVGFAGSALYSGMETGAYSLNRIRLYLLDHQHLPSAHTLRRLLENSTLLLSTLLIGNNLTNYLGTASLAVILQSQGFSEWESIILNTIIVTPILFIFGETLPKDLFAAHADRLMYPLARVLNASRWLFSATGLNAMIQAFSRVAMRAVGGLNHASPFHPRRRMQWLMREGVGYGVVSDEQSALVERVLTLAGRTVRDEMVPWKQVLTVRDTDGADALWTLADRTSRSRFPVLDAAGRVVGVVNLADALLYERDDCPSARELMIEPFFLDAATPLRRGLARLQREHAALAIIQNERHEPVGVASVKDLVEPITGDLAAW